MSIFLYNTLTRRKEAFTPRDVTGDAPGDGRERVTMYVCGPTVYSAPHIGNARPAVVFDVLARLLRSRYALTYARNITDVDDKINAAAQEAGINISEITSEFVTAYHADMQALGVANPDIEPRATGHIEQIVAMISRLIDSGHAYAADGHVLFRVSAFPAYGSLSRREQRELLAGARVEVAPYKEAPGDFILWKPSTPELPGWESPWGRGRPGWHIECSVMAAEHLGETIDIHGGGNDLIFPHHENEIAQSTCAHGGRQFARFWLHNGFVNVHDTKMSKSLGNIVLVRDLLTAAPGEAIRLALLNGHYRQPLDWSDELLSEMKRKLDRLYGTLRDIDGWQAIWTSTEPAPSFMAALEDDLNTPKAMAEIFNLARALNKSTDASERIKITSSLLAAGDLVGLLQSDPEEWFAGSDDGDLSASDIESLIEKRNEARAERNFAAADAIRDELSRKGVSIEDGPDGTKWRRG